ncbi:LacI family DNA-binding transcriptional regulator [Thermoflexus sp.]|uniref:LacI family DNA-binding transcriptional regulator n=1 Tax=Thermoflexus sp. TaxID=1969742 RepID=UPI0035E4039E
MKSIAQRAGVSVATVSRALSGRGRVDPATRERILRIAEELGYAPDMAARSLVLRRTENIGFLIHAIQSLSPHTFYGEILTAVERELRRHRYHLHFAMVEDETLPPLIKENRVDGLLLVGCDLSPTLIQSLKERGIPLVLVDNHLPGVDSVFTDNIGGAFQATAHLIRLGHRRIAFVTETMDNLSFRERFEGYRQALEAHHLMFDPELVAEGERGFEGGFAAMNRLLERTRPTAVVAANDPTAASAMRAIRARGLQIPKDIAVVGFDDDPLAVHTDPPLTTMRVFRSKMAALAVARLLDLTKNPEQPALHIRIETQLVVRQSCGSPLIPS